jgi:hypothetical protein
MGIERFFSSINKNFDIVSVMSNIKKLKTDVFFIDFNSIIHYVSSKYISEINTKGNINKNNTYDENSLILRVKNYVDDLLENEVLKNLSPEEQKQGEKTKKNIEKMYQDILRKREGESNIPTPFQNEERSYLRTAEPDFEANIPKFSQNEARVSQGNIYESSRRPDKRPPIKIYDDSSVDTSSISSNPFPERMYNKMMGI